ncbi:MAG: hypothetical protein KF829_09575 [Ferruginibacter sp.]|nr:hypothetical protein [Ferruginibacter sp.]
MLQQIAPFIGYLASLFLVLAIIVNNDLKFRWFSLWGNISFIIYALIINAIPVFITNFILLLINIYYLRKIHSRKEYFDLLTFAGNETLALRFVEFYKKDIERYFPQFTPDQLNNKLNFVVLRDLNIANMFCAELKENGDAHVLLNFTPQRYRDFKVGKFIFEREHDFLVSKGIKRIVYTITPFYEHQRFLKVMGFTKGTEPGHLLVKNIDA